MEISRTEITAAPAQKVDTVHTSKVLEEWRQNFRDLDVNGDGKLSVDEVRRVVMVLMKHTGGGDASTSDGWQEAAEMVAEADEDGDGFIDLQEFITLNHRMSLDVASRPQVSTTKRAGPKLDGVGAQGICAADQSQANSEDEKVLVDAFDVFDMNRDGRITAEELHAVLVELGGIGEGPKTFGAAGKASTSTSNSSNSTSLQECRRMIRAVDRNGVGYVDFHDFKRMMSMMMP